MGGKRQANVLSALIANFDTAEKAIEASANSAGSALRENEVYLDSIQGRIDIFNNSVQTMWSNFLDSDIVKDLIDLATGIVKVVDSIGLLTSALIAFGAYKGASLLFKSLKADGVTLKSVWKLMNQLTLATRQQQAADAAAAGTTLARTNAEKLLNLSIVKKIASEKLAEKTKIANLSRETALTSAKLALAKAEEQHAQGLIDATVVQAAKNKVDALSIPITAAQGGVLSVLGTVFSALAATIWSATKAMAAFLFTNPIGWAILAAGAIALISKIHKNTEELQEELDGLKSELSDTRSELESVNQELETTAERMEELLAKDKLTFAEQEELDRLRKVNDELERNKELLEDDEEYQSGVVGRKAAKVVKSAKSDTGFWEHLILGPSATTEEEDANNNLKDYKNLKEKFDNATSSKKRDRLQKRLDKKSEDIDEYIATLEKALEGVEYGDSAESDAALDYLAEFKTKYGIVRGFDSAKTSGIQGVLDKPEFESMSKAIDYYVKQLEKGDAGAANSIANIINNNKDFVEDLEARGLEAQDAIDYFTKLGEESHFDTIEGKTEELRRATAKLPQAFDNIDKFMDGDKVDKTAVAEYFKGTSEETREEIAQLIQDINDGNIDVEHALQKFELFGVQSVLEIKITEVQTNFKDAFTDLEGADGLIDTFQELADAIGSTSKAIDALNAAQAEMKANGRVSIETALKLMESTDDYSKVLTISEGKLVLAEDAEKNLIEARLEAMKASALKALEDAKAARETTVLAKSTAEAAMSTYNSAIESEMAAAVTATAWDKVLAAAAGLWAGIMSLFTDESWTEAYDRAYKETLDKIGGDRVAEVKAKYASEEEQAKKAKLQQDIDDAEKAIEEQDKEIGKLQGNYELVSGLNKDNIGEVFNSDGFDTVEDAIKDGWDKLIAEYENKLALITNDRNLIEVEVDFAEARGGQASKEMYDDLIRSQLEEKQLLEEKKLALEEYLKDHRNSIDPDTWTEYNNEINATAVAIKECEVNIVDYAKALRDIDMHYFEQALDEISRLGEEIEFVMSLFDDDDMFDEEGNWTDAGITKINLLRDLMTTAAAEATMWQDRLTDLDSMKIGAGGLYRFDESTKNAIAADFKSMLDSDSISEDTYSEYMSQLEEAFAAGGFSKELWTEWHNEAEDGLRDAISAGKDAQDQMIEMNDARIDAIEEGIQKEIEAYEEYIDVLKESLDAERDLYDFKKNVQKQSKDIAQLERRIASLSGSTNAADIAERRKLEAELLEAREGLNDTYYDHASEQQSKALDEESDAFSKAKEKYVETMREAAEDSESVINDMILNGIFNADVANEFLKRIQDTYNIPLSKELTEPWNSAATKAIDFKNQVGIIAGENIPASVVMISNSIITALGTDNEENPWNKALSMADKYADFLTTNEFSLDSSDLSTFEGQISKIIQGWKDVETAADKAYNAQTRQTTVGGTPQTGRGGKQKNLKKTTPDEDKGDQYVTSGQSISTLTSFSLSSLDGGKKYTDESTKKEYYKITSGAYKGYYIAVGSVLSGKREVQAYDGTKLYTKKYAKGTLGTKRDEWALTDEIGDELVLVPGANGNLSFMRKGTSVVPADITANLVEWGKLNPDMLKFGGGANINMINNAVNKPEINLDISEFLHVDHVDKDTMPELEKFVDKKMNDLVRQLNYGIKKFK